MKKWMNHRGITNKDIFYMLASMVPLTLFVGVMLYALIASAMQ